MKNVLEYVADVIGNDWRELLNILDCAVDYEMKEELPSQIVMKQFASHNFQVSWKELKKALEYIGREDMVKYIVDNTLITKSKFSGEFRVSQNNPKIIKIGKFSTKIGKFFTEIGITFTNIGEIGIVRPC